MGQYLKQRDTRSDLQQRLDAELRAKMAEKNKQEAERPDGIDDSAYIEGTKQTTGLDWAWMLILITMIVLFGVFVFIASR